MGKFLVLRSFGPSRCRQGGVLRLLPERESAPRGLLAGRRDRRFANATILAFLNPNKPIANKQTQIARQRRPLEALEVREPRRGNRAGLNQRRQEGELGAANPRSSHRLFEGAGQIPAMAPRGGAYALPGGDEVDVYRFHN
jgi:hypothetical protein